MITILDDDMETYIDLLAQSAIDDENNILGKVFVRYTDSLNTEEDEKKKWAFYALKKSGIIDLFLASIINAKAHYGFDNHLTFRPWLLKVFATSFLNTGL